MTVACERTHDVHRLEDENKRLRAAILDIDAHARPLDDDDGFVAGGYLVSIGALHRALALTGTAPPCPECPHKASHFTTLKKWNDGPWK